MGEFNRGKKEGSGLLIEYVLTKDANSDPISDSQFTFCERESPKESLVMKTKYEGTFVRNKQEGTGTMTWFREKGVKTYHGQWSEGKMHGSGVMTWSDGTRQTGTWFKGQRVGQGTIISASGEEVQVKFCMGKPSLIQNKTDAVRHSKTVVNNCDRNNNETQFEKLLNVRISEQNRARTVKVTTDSCLRD